MKKESDNSYDDPAELPDDHFLSPLFRAALLECVVDSNHKSFKQLCRLEIGRFHLYAKHKTKDWNALVNYIEYNFPEEYLSLVTDALIDYLTMHELIRQSSGDTSLLYPLSRGAQFLMSREKVGERASFLGKMPVYTDGSSYRKKDLRRAGSYLGTHIISWSFPVFWIYTCWRLRTVMPLLLGFIVSFFISYALSFAPINETVTDAQYYSQLRRISRLTFLLTAASVSCAYILNARRKLSISKPEVAQNILKSLEQK